MPPGTPATKTSRSKMRRRRGRKSKSPGQKDIELGGSGSGSLNNEAAEAVCDKNVHDVLTSSRSDGRTHTRTLVGENGSDDEGNNMPVSARNKRAVIIASDSEGVVPKNKVGLGNTRRPEAVDISDLSDSSAEQARPGSPDLSHLLFRDRHLRGDGSNSPNSEPERSHVSDSSEGSSNCPSLRHRNIGNNSSSRDNKSSQASWRAFAFKAIIMFLIGILLQSILFTTPKTEPSSYRYRSWTFPPSTTPAIPVWAGDAHLDVRMVELANPGRLIIKSRRLPIDDIVADMADAYTRAFVMADMMEGLPCSGNTTSNLTLGGVYYHAGERNKTLRQGNLDAARRVASLNMTLTVIAAWDLTRYIGYVTSDLVNLTMDHLSSPNEPQRASLLRHIAPRSFLHKNGLQWGCAQVFKHRWLPRSISPESIEIVARWLDDMADRVDERPGYTEPTMPDGQVRIGTKTPSQADLLSLAHLNTPLPSLLSRLRISPEAKFALHAANWSLARLNMARPISDLCEHKHAEALARVALGECIRPTEPSSASRPASIPGLYEAEVYSVLCIMDQELTALVERVAHIRHRLRELDELDSETGVEASRETEPHQDRGEKVAAQAADRKRAYINQYKTQANIVLDQAIVHIETHIRPSFALHRRAIQHLSARFLESCSLYNSLRDRLAPLFAQQSAWWRVEWIPKREAIGLSLVTIPSLNSSRLHSAAAHVRSLLGGLPAAYAVDMSLSFRFTAYPGGSYNAQWITDAGFGYEALSKLKNLVRQEHNYEMFCHTQDERYLYSTQDWTFYREDFTPNQCFKEGIPDRWEGGRRANWWDS